MKNNPCPDAQTAAVINNNTRLSTKTLNNLTVSVPLILTYLVELSEPIELDPRHSQFPVSRDVTLDNTTTELEKVTLYKRISEITNDIVTNDTCSSEL